MKFRNKRKINRWSPSLFSSSITYIKGNWSVEKIICQTISIHLKGGKKKKLLIIRWRKDFSTKTVVGIGSLSRVLHTRGNLSVTISNGGKISAGKVDRSNGRGGRGAGPRGEGSSSGSCTFFMVNR